MLQLPGYLVPFTVLSIALVLNFAYVAVDYGSGRAVIMVLCHAHDVVSISYCINVFSFVISLLASALFTRVLPLDRVHMYVGCL